MFNDIIKLDYKEDFTLPLSETYRGNSGYFVKIDVPDVFNTKGLIGYSILKNQLVCIKSSYMQKYKGLFKTTQEKETCEKFSHLEDLYVYYRVKPDNMFTTVSKFVTNKLILEPPKQEIIVPESERYLGEIITRQQIISHKDGGWCIVTYNSVTDKIIGCSERFDYQ